MSATLPKRAAAATTRPAPVQSPVQKAKVIQPAKAVTASSPKQNTSPAVAQPAPVRATNAPAPEASFEPEPFDFTSEPTGELADPLALPDDYSQPATGATYYTPVKSKKRSVGSGLSPNVKRWIVPGAIAAGIIVLVGGFFATGGLRRGGLLSSIGYKLVQVLRLDSPEQFSQDLQEERERIQTYGLPLLENQDDEDAVQRLLAEIPKLQGMVSRAANLPVAHMSASEIAAQNDKMLAERERWSAMSDEEREAEMEQRSGGRAELNFEFWSRPLGATPEDRAVDHAIQHLAGWIGVAQRTQSIAKSFPDPRDDPPIVESWTKEERRDLAAYHIASELNRDFYRALAMCDLGNLQNARLDHLHNIIDTHFARAEKLAQEIAEAHVDTSRSMLIPRATPYEKFLNITSEFAAFFGKMVRREATSNLHLAALITDQQNAAAAIGKLTFKSELDIVGTSRQRCEELEQLLAKQLQEQRLAEEAQIARQKANAERIERERIAASARREEEARKRAEELAQREAEAEKRKADEAAARADNADNAPAPSKPSSGPSRNPASGLLPGPFGGRSPRNGFGSRPDEPQMPSASIGGPRTNPPSQRPPADTTLSVTIKVSEVTHITTKSLVTGASRELRSYGFRAESSGGSLTITVRNYDQPLENLAALLPELQFQSIDTETRTIIAIEAPQ